MLEILETNPEHSSGHAVFLHGSGTGPWIWEAVRRHLPVASTALTVPSDRSGTDPVLCASEILSDPAFPTHGPVVLVLHSLAGVLEAPLAQALGDRLLHVVLVASVVPAPGRTFASTMGFPASLILPLLFRFQPQGLVPSPSMIVDQLGTDLDDAQRTELVARFRPEMRGLFLERVPVEEARIPRTYLLCQRDRSVSPALQTRIATRLGAQIRSLESGHLPMLSRPAEVAGIIAQVASEAFAATPAGTAEVIPAPRQPGIRPQRRETTTTDL